MGMVDNADIEQDEGDSEDSCGDTEQLEVTNELETDEVRFKGEEWKLPRPPTKPNVSIEDESICPVCTQPGKFE